jgi:SAM-dependent methyltransferase
VRHFEQFFIPIYQRSLEQLQLTKRRSLLDFGGGPGLFSMMAAKTGATVRVVDGPESLPFGNDSFDAVTAFNSLQYPASLDNALKEARRVLRSGGQLAIAIWDQPELSDASEVLKALATLVLPPPPGNQGLFAFSEPGTVEAVCEAHGFQVDSVTGVVCPMLFHSVREGIDSFMGTAPAADAAEYTTKEIAEEAIGVALDPFYLGDERYLLVNRFRLFMLHKP